MHKWSWKQLSCVVGPPLPVIKAHFSASVGWPCLGILIGAH